MSVTNIALISGGSGIGVVGIVIGVLVWFRKVRRRKRIERHRDEMAEGKPHNERIDDG